MTNIKRSKTQIKENMQSIFPVNQTKFVSTIARASLSILRDTRPTYSSQDMKALQALKEYGY